MTARTAMLALAALTSAAALAATPAAAWGFHGVAGGHTVGPNIRPMYRPVAMRPAPSYQARWASLRWHPTMRPGYAPGYQVRPSYAPSVAPVSYTPGYQPVQPAYAPAPVAPSYAAMQPTYAPAPVATVTPSYPQVQPAYPVAQPTQMPCEAQQPQAIDPQQQDRELQKGPSRRPVSLASAELQKQ